MEAALSYACGYGSLAAARFLLNRGVDPAARNQKGETALHWACWKGYADLVEVLEVHLGLRGAAARARAVELLATVGIPEPERRFRAYPFQLSGGMRQRVMIAMAIACRPPLLIADEPTTALDATVQAQVLELIQSLGRELGTATILITHNLGIVAGL